MDSLNRFQALIRHPEYCREVRPHLPQTHGLLDFMSEIAEKRLTQKQWNDFVEGYVVIRRWGLGSFVDPNDESQIASEMVKLRSGDHSIFANDLRCQDADQYDAQIDPGHLSPIILYVDLHQPDSYLKEQFIQKLQEERKKSGITSQREKPNRENIWQVWDLRETHKKKFREIASILCGESDDPVSDDTAKAACDRLQDAYQKAVRFIKEVGDARNTSITYEAVEASLIRDINMLFHQVSLIRS